MNSSLQHTAVLLPVSPEQRQYINSSNDSWQNQFAAMTLITSAKIHRPPERRNEHMTVKGVQAHELATDLVQEGSSCSPWRIA